MGGRRAGREEDRQRQRGGGLGGCCGRREEPRSPGAAAFSSGADSNSNRILRSPVSLLTSTSFLKTFLWCPEIITRTPPFPETTARQASVLLRTLFCGVSKTETCTAAEGRGPSALSWAGRKVEAVPVSWWFRPKCLMGHPGHLHREAGDQVPILALREDSLSCTRPGRQLRPQTTVPRGRAACAWVEAPAGCLSGAQGLRVLRSFPEGRV